MRRASTVLGQAVQHLLHGHNSSCGLQILSATTVLKPASSQHIYSLSAGAHSCGFHTSCSSSKKSSSRSASRKQQGTTAPSTHQPQHSRQQQQQLRWSKPQGPSSWPQPSRLVIPAQKAVAPPLGRVPPSSRAAAAATAAMIKSATASAASAADAAASKPPSINQQPTIHITGKPVTDSNDSPADSSSSSAAAAATPAPSSSSSAVTPPQSQQRSAYPWEVVAAINHSSPFTLELMSDMNLHTYLTYLKAARLGMPSIFELGVTREQGKQGRVELLRRELLLKHVLQQLTSTSSSPAAAAAVGSSSRTDKEDIQDVHPVQQQQQQQEELVAVSDDALQEATQDQLAAAAAAAAASSVFAAGANGDEVGECLLDYFVMKRCMQVMLYQRQHRQLMQQQYMQITQQQQQSGSSSSTSGAEDNHLSAEDIQSIDIFDAFFDADLNDYENYLAAAAGGEPSVFTTVNPAYQNPNQQQQQDVEEARQELASAAAVLSRLPAGIKSRPLMLIGGSQILQLSVDSGVSVESVVEIFEGFYRLKRLGFRQALQQLIDAADDDAPLQRFQ